MSEATRSGPFWDMIEGRAPMPPVARLLGWTLLSIDPECGEIRVRFEAKPDFLNPAGTVQGGFCPPCSTTRWAPLPSLCSAAIASRRRLNSRPASIGRPAGTDRRLWPRRAPRARPGLSRRDAVGRRRKVTRCGDLDRPHHRACGLQINFRLRPTSGGSSSCRPRPATCQKPHRRTGVLRPVYSAARDLVAIAISRRLGREQATEVSQCGTVSIAQSNL